MIKQGRLRNRPCFLSGRAFNKTKHPRYAISISINEVTLRYDSAILAGWCHGVFNSQAYGIWRLLFPTVNPILGGLTRIVGVLVYTAVGLLAIRWLKRNQPVARNKAPIAIHQAGS